MMTTANRPTSNPPIRVVARTASPRPNPAKSESTQIN